VLPKGANQGLRTPHSPCPEPSGYKNEGAALPCSCGASFAPSAATADSEAGKEPKGTAVEVLNASWR
jgi:hypothetical protein